jgi:hypothetical protein
VLDNHLSIGTFFKGCVMFLLDFSEFSRGPDIDPSPQFWPVSAYGNILGAQSNGKWQANVCNLCTFYPPPPLSSSEGASDILTAPAWHDRTFIGFRCPSSSRASVHYAKWNRITALGKEGRKEGNKEGKANDDLGTKATPPDMALLATHQTSSATRAEKFCWD